ncbi:hypothetical protein GGI25_004545 [Coemansia spiralis]|uniref:NADP-dependent oxidoreductase domain-containing protein n=2 Tax=Coemansia TaxID=4863 RepID=A0A9W8KXA3_9FUNG|nr:hypothetical protein EDC05_004385 [Coemansia umbellata]KAJ2620665.1 hypothetical protein GGI26_004827 [Coemansia sp. RSA 1358]KAJ2673798.1 hypothetical protein GGI25_004545 [Coemansia spiralis]
MSAAPTTIEIGIPGDRIRVPRIGLGAMGLSTIYGVPDDDESIKVLNHAIDIGCTFWDTANLYGLGHNERLLSRVLKERRNEVFLCTKFGVVFEEPEPGFNGFFGPHITGISGKPEYVRKCAEESLQRLGVDKIDLYYMHRVDPKTPIEETVGAMAELVKEGKVHYLGLSGCTADEVRRAYKVHPIAAVEVEYNAWSISIETNGLLDVCHELGITLVAHSPLGSGFLTGQIRSINDLPVEDMRHRLPQFKLDNFASNFKLVEAFERIAGSHGYMPAQFAIAWLLAQSANIIAIPGTKRIKYLEENFAAGQIKMTEEELKELRSLISNSKH